VSHQSIDHGTGEQHDSDPEKSLRHSLSPQRPAEHELEEHHERRGNNSRQIRAAPPRHSRSLARVARQSNGKRTDHWDLPNSSESIALQFAIVAVRLHGSRKSP